MILSIFDFIQIMLEQHPHLSLRSAEKNPQTGGIVLIADVQIPYSIQLYPTYLKRFARCNEEEKIKLLNELIQQLQLEGDTLHKSIMKDLSQKKRDATPDESNSEKYC